MMLESSGNYTLLYKEILIGRWWVGLGVELATLHGALAQQHIHDLVVASI
jgi:hypothetical protein